MCFSAEQLFCCGADESSVEVVRVALERFYELQEPLCPKTTDALDITRLQSPRVKCGGDFARVEKCEWFPGAC